MSKGMEPARDSEESLNIPWRSVALISASVAVCVSVGTLGALVVVASVQDADVLSTVALALAVLAFTSQILVFVAQVFASNKQTARQDELYARMNGLLQGLKGTTDATHATMDRHMEVLLKAAVGEAAEVVGESSDSDGTVVPKFNPLQFEQRVLERAREVAAESRATDFDFQPSQVGNAAVDPARIHELETYPEKSEVAEQSLELLKRISPWGVQVLARFGEDELSSLKAGIPPGLRKMRRAPITWELVTEKLVEFIGEPDEDPAVARLTDQGRAVVRLIIPSSRPPDWIVQQLNTTADSPGP